MVKIRSFYSREYIADQDGHYGVIFINIMGIKELRIVFNFDTRILFIDTMPYHTKGQGFAIAIEHEKCPLVPKGWALPHLDMEFIACDDCITIAFPKENP